jgi:leucyl-tRNA synthetase
MKDKKNLYILVEFPYPSGSGLHVGHVFNYTGADVYARFKRMQGFNVLFPMGWDAFGLPTENYAIKMKKNPKEVTRENTEMFKKQMKEMNFSFDWEREINTTDPEYYKWTQWIFIKLFEKGLAYKKEIPINWCPSCKIGLANEEVVGNNCERCGTKVNRRNMSQWVVKITDYADRLIAGLDKTNFIDKVKQSQINWIGKSQGAKINFQFSNSNQIEVFTTRPDTLPSATFLVLAPEHALISDIILRSSRASHDCGPKITSEIIMDVKNYVEKAGKKSEFERGEINKEKTGVFTGLYVTNPYNQRKMPVWVSDFVLATYGTGAIMSVPTQDERDAEFAKKFDLPVVDEANLEMKEALKYGKTTVSYHLRDWIFSRQHYWGEPIPMINCKKCGWVPVAEDQLPVVLPEIDFYEPTETGESPLSKIADWVKTSCPKCGGEANRETDTMPNWAGSDWYYLRYIDPHNKEQMCDIEKAKEWMPVDLYIGGDEHNTLHLLYSRFIYQFLFDLGIVPTPEPYDRRMSHGVILGPDNQRMSKSRGNVVILDEILKKYGVGVARTYLMFMGPFDSTMAWNEKTLIGVKRFIDRFSSYIKQNKYVSVSNDDVKMLINKLIKEVTNDMNLFKYNTAIAKIMKALNELTGKSIDESDKNALLSLLAPFLGDDKQNKWPEVDEKYLREVSIVVPIAINGKVRAQIEVDLNITQEEIIRLAKEKVATWTENKKVAKEIYVPLKMVNLVLE